MSGRKKIPIPNGSEGSHTHTDTHTHTHRHTNTHTNTHRHAHTDTQTHTQTHTQTRTHTPWTSKRTQAHFDGCKADRTKIRMITSTEPGGTGSWWEESVMSHWKAWHLLASYSSCSCPMRLQHNAITMAMTAMVECYGGIHRRVTLTS